MSPAFSLDLFLTLLHRLVPLYLLVLAGFVAGRVLRTSKEDVAALLIYFITPLVVLNGVLQIQLGWSTLSLPLVFFVLCCSVCLLVYAVGAKVFARSGGPTRNLAAFCGNGNTGYFGLPVAMTLLGTEVLGWMVLCSLGFILYENTLGFFITARGNSSVRESLRRVVRLPTIYAFLIGVLLNAGGIRIEGTWTDLFQAVRGTYSVLGMMIIGLGVAAMKPSGYGGGFDGRFLTVTFLAKFALWPAVVALLVAANDLLGGLWEPRLVQVMKIISIVPLAANTVSVAALLRTEPEKAAIAVLLSTAVGLFYIPLMTGLWIY